MLTGNTSAERDATTESRAHKLANGARTFGLTELADVTRSGEVRLKKADVKRVLEEAFEEAARKAASGERVRIPFLGGLAMREVKPRKAGRGINPFTGEEVAVQARPASRKPRFSFTKAAKEVYADKKNWK